MIGCSLDHLDIDLRGTELANKFLEGITLHQIGSSTAGLLAVSGSLVERMPLPALSIFPGSAVSALHIEWSCLTTNFVVEQTTSLAGPWTTVPAKPDVSQGTNYWLTLPVESTDRFFRIRLP
jgi:hypothetical protein